MKIQLIQYPEYCPQEGSSTIYIRTNIWNDYGFETLFHIHVHDEKGEAHHIGAIKIGFKKQVIGIPTKEKLQELAQDLSNLPEQFFSLGQDVDFYKKIFDLGFFGEKVLKALNDISYDLTLLDKIADEEVFKMSFLRDISLTTIRKQFSRIIKGQALLEDYYFKFDRKTISSYGAISDLSFNVVADATPSKNIHCLIGRNGVGKTTLLNHIVNTLFNRDDNCEIVDKYGDVIPKDYFSNVISISFSAFDPFEPSNDQTDPTKGTCFYYIGLKNRNNNELKSSQELREDAKKALKACLTPNKKQRLLSALRILDSDPIFADFKIIDLIHGMNSDELSIEEKNKSDEIGKIINQFSSGHAIVFLILVSLVARVEEKTLVLIDEPESYLHPPLLSAFIRSLSNLLHDRNGVAILATHSPVVLQEIPKSCIWKINRSNSVIKIERPSIESFGEDVGILTQEVFRLEVQRSGFYALLNKEVDAGKTYSEILKLFNDEIGEEGRFILRTLLANKNKDND